jgi:hypothetical protein
MKGSNRMSAVHKLIDEAIQKSRFYVFESDTELVFCDVPQKLSRNGYCAGAVVGSLMAREIVLHALELELPIRFLDTKDAPDESEVERLKALCRDALELRGLEYDINSNHKLNPQERGAARRRAMEIEEALRKVDGHGTNATG